jgi:predicted phosphodiesterase
MSKVLVIPDTQIPFAHKEAIPFLKLVEKTYKPDRVVHIGDLIDSHAVSFHDHDPDGLSAGDELKATVKELKAWYKAFPKVDFVEGNHDLRFYRTAFSLGLPRAVLRDLHDLLEMPKTWTVQESVEIDGVIYEHGDGLKGGLNGSFRSAVDGNQASTVFGHFHSSAGIRYFANKRRLMFSMNVGCLMNTHSYAAAYGKKLKDKPILGCGLVLDGIPVYVPMVLNSKSQWVGKL